MHHVSEIGLDLRLSHIYNFEAFIDKKLLAFNGLGSFCLSSIVGLYLAHEGRDALVLWQTDEQVENFGRVATGSASTS